MTNLTQFHQKMATDSWAAMKHRPAARTDVHNPIRQLLEKEMVFPKDHAKPMINLGLGEPTRANGFELPEVINQSIIEVIQSEQHNGYG